MRLLRIPYINTTLLLTRRRALMRGVLGNSLPWRIVAIVIFGSRLMRWLLRRQPEVVTVEKLRPGQAMSLRTIPYVSRRERRRAASSGR